MKVHKDERKWSVTITMDKSECPFLSYPANYHGCTERERLNPTTMGRDETWDCNMDSCPYKSSDEVGNEDGQH